MPNPRPPCGTVGGWWAHRRRGEVTCLGCCDALAADKRVKRAAEIDRILSGQLLTPRVVLPCGTEAAARRHRRAGQRWQDCPSCAAAGITWS